MHRVPIINTKGEVTNIITQSTVIDFLEQNLSKLGPIVDSTVGDLMLGHKVNPIALILTLSHKWELSIKQKGCCNCKH